MTEIRQTAEENLADVRRLWADGDVMRFVGFPNGLRKTEAEMRKWLKRIESERPAADHYSVFEDGVYCGEAYYRIDRDHGLAAMDVKLFGFARGRGIAAKALSHAIGQAFENGADAVWVDPHPDNTKAIALYERLGFRRKARPEFLPSDGWVSVYMELDGGRFREGKITPGRFLPKAENDRDRPTRDRFRRTIREQEVNNMAKFFCGASRADITPAVGTLLFGYNPHQESTSIHDRLNVTAAAFSDGGETAVLVTADVCEIQTALSDEIRKAAGDAAGIPWQNILFSATHTHSAPNVTGMEGWGDVDRPYVDAVFLPAVVRAVKEAVRAMEPAVLGISETESRVGVNRRELKRGGRVDFGQNPWGPFDPIMTVIAVKSADGRGILNLVHYGCHGTAAGCNREISRDWSGMMVDRMERETGVMTAYWQGACGDTGPRISNGCTTGDITYVEELGSAAAMDAVRAWRQIRSYHTPSLAVFRGTVRIPCAPLPTEEEAEAKLASWKDPASLINIQAMEYGHWRDVLAAVRNGETPPEAFSYDTTLVALGDVLWIPHPFEMFSEITLRLRQYAPYAHVLSLSTTNGTNEYLPSKGEMLRGGYEVDCFRYGHVFPMTDDADEYIIEENLRILGV